MKRVVVDTPWSKGIHLEVRSSDTVRDVKRKIKGSDATPPGKKHLFFAGRQLEDTRTLSACRVQLFLAGGKLEDGRTLGSQGIEDESTLLLLESVSGPTVVFMLYFWDLMRAHERTQSPRLWWPRKLRGGRYSCLLPFGLWLSSAWLHEVGDWLCHARRRLKTLV